MDASPMPENELFRWSSKRQSGAQGPLLSVPVCWAEDGQGRISPVHPNAGPRDSNRAQRFGVQVRTTSAFRCVPSLNNASPRAKIFPSVHLSVRTLTFLPL